MHIHHARDYNARTQFFEIASRGMIKQATKFLWNCIKQFVYCNKKLSYRRETARQLPTWRGPAVCKAHFKMNRAFKVIQGHPYWCRQESRMVCCRNVQLMPTLFMKLTKIRQREHSKLVHFNDPTQVLRRPSKKRLRISTNDLYCQKLELLTYIFVADSMGLHSLVFT